MYFIFHIFFFHFQCSQVKYFESQRNQLHITKRKLDEYIAALSVPVVVCEFLIQNFVREDCVKAFSIGI